MSENTSRIRGVPKASRNRKESRTVVEVGKAAMCRHLDQLVNNRTKPWHSGLSGRAKLAFSYPSPFSGEGRPSEAEAGWVAPAGRGNTDGIEAIRLLCC